jgi:hypothetical protein
MIGMRGTMMTRVKASGARLILAIGIGAALMAGGCRAQSAPAPTERPDAVFPVRETGRLRNADIVEASGMAHSRRVPDLLWVINDGGHPAELFAVRTDGRDLGRVAAAGAVNTDWEDLAAFTWQGRDHLLIADVGDNRAVRPAVRIYVVVEPVQRASGAFPPQVAVAWQFDFVYEDGPRDCEGAAVDVAAGQILLVTKRTTPPQLYRLPLQPPPGRRVTARRIGAVPHIPPPTPQDLITDPRFGALQSQPTAMDIREDSALAVVVTYKDAYLYPRPPGATWAEALAARPRIVRLPRLAQTEAGCLRPDGRRLYVSTEQRPAPLLAIDLTAGP